MKEIFENHFSNLVIWGEKLGSHTPKYNKHCFNVETEKFVFTFTRLYIEFSAQNMAVVHYNIDHQLSLDDNIRNFQLVFYKKINENVSYLKESLANIKKALELKENLIKEFEEHNKMSIFL
jgi:hypothetical protein